MLSHRGGWLRRLRVTVRLRTARLPVRRLPVLACSAALALSLLVPRAAAQNLGRHTLGIQFAYLNTLQPAPAGAAGTIGANYGTCNCGYPGVGVRFTGQWIQRMGLDVEFDYLPGQGPSGVKASFTEFLVGPRFLVGSSQLVRVYAYFRPGLLHLNSPPVSIGTPGGGVTFFPGSESDLVFDPGVSISVPVTSQWLSRIDFSGLWITGSGCSNCVGGAAPLPALNLQASLGFAYRF